MFKLPPLPYPYDALEPYIDARTMEIHHDKHHQKYVDDLNAALAKHPEFEHKSLIDLLTHLDTLPEDIRTAVRNNAGGDYNHSQFWLMMKKGGSQPKGKIRDEILKTFKSFDNFKTQFNAAAKSRFGSGWAWLSIDQDGKLTITSTPNQDNPITQGLSPVLGLDVWEHAYYLKYQNRSPDYIDAWWNVVNWDQVESNYQEYM